ncbi:MAG TPA: hypothetical protein VII79_05400 [Candidatus Dormibacteraeota bacterium]
MENDRPRLTPLWVFGDAQRPNRWLAVAPVLAAVLFAVSMRLVWHHKPLTGPVAGYTVVYGIQGASWLLVAAGLAAGFALRVFIKFPGGYLRASLTLLAFLITIGIYADYLDEQERAGQLYAGAYVGPGFYVALAGTALMVLAAVLVWTVRD